MNTHRNRNIMKHAGPVAKAFTLGSAALIALSGSVQAQAVDGTDGVTMGGSAMAPAGSGAINGLSVNTFPGQANLSWTNQALSGFVVPAGQFTGIAMDGSNVAHADLLPIRGQSFSVADANDVTADVVQIDANGITTGALSILDSSVVDSNGDPVQQAITVDNGALSVGGTVVSAGGPTNTMNLLDQTVVDSNSDPVLQALTVDEGELMLNGNPVVEEPDPLPTAGGFLNNMVPVTRADGTVFWVARTELTYGDWLQGFRIAIDNGYIFGTNFPSDSSKSTLITQVSVVPSIVNNNQIVVVNAAFSDGQGTSDPGMSMGGFDHPVSAVSYRDAAKWCNAVSQALGLQPVFYTDAAYTTILDTQTSGAIFYDTTQNGLRIPEEADYDLLYANLSYSEGSAHVNTVAGVTAHQTTARVGSYPVASEHGLFDLIGNLEEMNAVQGVSQVKKSGGSMSGGLFSGSNFNFKKRWPLNVGSRQAIVGFRLMRND